MEILFKSIWLIIVAAAGFIFVPLCVHFMIAAGVLDTANAPEGYLSTLLQKTSYIWVASCLIGILSVFVVQKNLRIALLLCPLILPAIFALIYTMMQT